MEKRDNEIPGFSNDTIYGIIVCGRKVTVPYNTAIALVDYCASYAEENGITVIASPTTDMRPEKAAGRRLCTLLVGIKAAMLKLPGEFHSRKGLGSSEFGITTGVTSNMLTMALMTAQSLPLTFWMRIATISGDESLLRQQVRSSITSCGPLSTARMITPGSELIEVGFTGSQYRDFTIEEGTYEIEAQHDLPLD
jgi:hypothetical protein